MIKLLVNLVLAQQWKIYSWMNLTECIRPSNTHLSMQNLPVSQIFKYTFGVQMSTLADGARNCSRLRFTSLQMLCGASDFGSDKFLPETAYMENKIVLMSWELQCSWKDGDDTLFCRVDKKFQMMGVDLKFCSWKYFCELLAYSKISVMPSPSIVLNALQITTYVGMICLNIGYLKAEHPVKFVSCTLPLKKMRRRGR